MSKTRFSRLYFQQQTPFYPPLVDLCLIPYIIVFFIGEYCFRDASTLSSSWSCTYPFTLQVSTLLDPTCNVLTVGESVISRTVVSMVLVPSLS
jgi:hypothetical protein